MFTISKLFWWLFQPSNLLLLLLVAGAALLWSRHRNLGRRLVAAAAAIAVIIAVVPLDAWMIRSLENRFPAVEALPERVTGIITLGGAVDQAVTAARGQISLKRYVERLTVFVALAHRYPEARLAYTGGSASLFRPDLKEVPVARRFFAEMGLDPVRVAFEDRARNTHENAVFAHALLRPGPGETWVLITSAMHMPRAVGAFRKAGWHVLPYPVDYVTAGRGGFSLRLSLSTGLAGLSAAVKEWTGLVAYYLLGRTGSLFPGPDD